MNGLAWTFEDDRRLAALAEEGRLAALAEEGRRVVVIAERLKRSRSAVYQRAKKLGVRFNTAKLVPPFLRR
jgi:DNA-binding Lrp family transcriptional regulator